MRNLSARFALPSGSGIRRHVRLMHRDQILIWPTGWSNFDSAFEEADRLLGRALSRLGHDGSITSSRGHSNQSFPGRFDWTTMARRVNRDFVTKANLPVGSECWVQEVQWGRSRGRYNASLAVAFTRFDSANALQLMNVTGTREVTQHAAQALAALGLITPP